MSSTTSSIPSSSTSSSTPSQVRVGVRIRPLTNNEKSQGGKSIITSCAINRTADILKRKFTYDAVYDPSVSQTEMYECISGTGRGRSRGSSAPHNTTHNGDGMLEAFLDGYNSTIMAYGQTGSGKTFTMGSEATTVTTSPTGDEDFNQGLIPRFMTDIFSSLEQRMKPNETSMDRDACTNQGQLIDYSVSASFLEIYSEEIHDLLGNDSKQTLPIRDDANGGVVVVGLKEKVVKNAQEALQVLNVGTLNRTTAQTLMNKKSSRSHAVFTIHLKQTNREIGGAPTACKNYSNQDGTSTTSCTTSSTLSTDPNSNNADFMDVTTTSRFTFVDLAGSERLKKTGAEGERAKEGIKINEGLLALGNVINALGDEERLMRGEKVHVPYRQSKLTRLLQDALGGNSKTLFLACVSPSDTNASETVSTLKYANRARNIKNAPTKNIDASVAELQRLYSLTTILERELVKTRFGTSSLANPSSNEEQSYSDNRIGEDNENLLNREDVQKYLAEIYQKADEANVTSASTNLNRFQKINCHSHTISAITPTKEPVSSAKNSSNPINEDKRSQTANEAFDTIIDVNPDEDIALLDKILELQHLDQEFDKEHKQDEEKLNEVEGELEEQESLLLQLKDNLKAYHNMKERFEAMMIEVQDLESEKSSIAKELERVQHDPSKGCSKAIKKRLEKVESNLSRARCETRKHQQMYRKAEQQAQKVNALQKKIEALKHGKVSLIRKQREAAAKHKESTDKKSREIMALKKKERKDGHKMSKLESEVQKHKNHLQRRAEFCDKLSEKLKQTESHLMKVLSLRKRDLHDRSQKAKRQGKRGQAKLEHKLVTAGFAPESQEISSLKFLLEKIISDRASVSLLNKEYENKVAEYSDLMRCMVKEMKILKEAKNSFSSLKEDEKSEIRETIEECNHNIEDLELKIEVVGNDLEYIRSRLPSVKEFADEEDLCQEQKQSKLEEDAMKMISNLSAPITKTLLWDILDITTKAEVEKSILCDKLNRKEAALHSFEEEILSLTQQIELLHQDVNKKSNTSNCNDDCNREIPTPMKMKKAQIKQLEKVLSQLENENEKTQNELRQKTESLFTVKEELTIMEVTMRNKGEEATKKVQDTLKEVQSIWKEVGVSDEDREKTRLKIDSSLEDTCTNVLLEARSLKEKLRKEIKKLFENIKCTYIALGRDDEFLHLEESMRSHMQTYYHQLEFLRQENQKLLPSYTDAIDRITRIADEAGSILTSMELPLSTLGSNISKIIKIDKKSFKRRGVAFLDYSSVQPESAKDERAKKRRQVEEMMKALESENSDSTFCQRIDCNIKDSSSDEKNSFLEPNSLADVFIDECEKELITLKRMKSEAMVENHMCRDQAKKLTNEMHLQGRELSSLTVHSIKKRSKELPKWWDPQVAEEACRAIVSRDCIIDVSSSYTKHLNLIRDSLLSVSSGRSALSTCMKRIIEGAHSTLLETVEGDIDANEAYNSFDKALARLPKLSKEHISACLNEMNTLVTAVHNMSQSETEALTVVWQALNVSNSERGQFWSDVDEYVKKLQASKNNEFEVVIKTCADDIEEWVIDKIKKSTKVNRELNDRLFKLSKIHHEVERLRSKQDAKSKIMSLDSELCILSSKLAEFEEKAGSKHRLVTKKMNSSSLLQEERFRKQMQNNFSSKLHTLVKLLNEWQLMEGKSFDEKMLSEDVNAFLKNPDQCGDWIEKRIAFMHLKTVKQKPRRKVLDDARSLSNSPQRTNISTTRKHANATNKDYSTKKVPNRQRLNETKEKVSLRYGHSHRANTPATANDKDSRSVSRQRSKTHSASSMQPKRTLRDKNDKITTNFMNSATPPKKHNIDMTIDISDTSSPILPFGQVLAKTPVQKENNQRFQFSS